MPARLAPGSWYALPQSPQLFKQLLMVAGMERYFQIARCYRDEDFRADRQPEFTQLDVEMSFVDQDDVIALSERIIAEVWSLIGYQLPNPLPRLTFTEAMDRYGSDKPDLRFDLELTELTEYFADTPFRSSRRPTWGGRDAGWGVPAASHLRRLAGVGQAARRQGLAYVTIADDGAMAARSARTSRTPNATGWRPRPAPGRATASSSPPVPGLRPSICWGRPATRSPVGAT